MALCEDALVSNVVGAFDVNEVVASVPWFNANGNVWPTMAQCFTQLANGPITDIADSITSGGPECREP